MPFFESGGALEIEGKHVIESQICFNSSSPDDVIGSSVATNKDKIIVGAPVRKFTSNNEEILGTIDIVYVVSRRVQIDWLMASDTKEGDSFGQSVSISAQPQTVVVGSSSKDPGSHGAVYIFELEND